MIKDGIKYVTVFFTASEKARPATPQEHRSSIADFLDRVQENVVFIHFNLQGPCGKAKILFCWYIFML